MERKKERKRLINREREIGRYIEIERKRERA
jgi:hypothetical protein